VGRRVPTRHRRPSAQRGAHRRLRGGGPDRDLGGAHRLPVLVGIGIVAVGILWLFDLTIGWSFLVI
jgi:hypothetical protein